MDKITLYSNNVCLSEDNSNPDSYIAKFIICDFGRNKNGVALKRDSIEQWMSTLNRKPLVGKIKMKYDGTYDFTGHNVKVVEKSDNKGNKYQEVEFDTEAFGTFFDVSIEEIDGTEYIVAYCEIWKRFTKACEIIVGRINEGSLSTSWEISIEKSSNSIVDGLMTKVIEVGRFIGHCLLGKSVEPAYDSSGLLEIASTEYDNEFAEALSHDILSQGSDMENLAKEVNNLEDTKTTVGEKVVEETVVETPVAEVAEEINSPESVVSEETSIPEDIPVATVSEEEPLTEHVVEESAASEPEIESAQLTVEDLYRKITKACREKIDKWCYISFMFPADNEVWVREECCESELELLRFNYTVSNDNVEVSEPEKVVLTVSLRNVNETVAQLNTNISEKDNLILEASSEITSLKSEISELSQYKEKIEQIEQEKAKAEFEEKKEALISDVTKSGYITRSEIEESEKLTEYVNNLDRASLMSVVGERLSASCKKNKDVETSQVKTKEVHVSTNLNTEESDMDYKSIMDKFLGGKKVC